MAQSDFIFSNSYPPFSSSSGIAVVNSTLSNPLPSASFGDYCRDYHIPATGVPASIAFVWNGFVSSSNFIGIPGNKAQSLRILARCSTSVTPPADGTTVNVGIRTRCSNNYISGYSLTLGNLKNYFYDSGGGFIAVGTKDTFGLRLSLRKSDGNKDNNFPDVLVSGSFNKDTWYPIRMDVIPYGSSHDIINIYTGSMDVNGAITWSNILYTKNVLTSDSVYNVPNVNQYCGYTIIGENMNGYGDTSNPAKGYIDGLDIRISPV